MEPTKINPPYAAELKISQTGTLKGYFASYTRPISVHKKKAIEIAHCLTLMQLALWTTKSGARANSGARE
jgi:hypothetical protein